MGNRYSDTYVYAVTGSQDLKLVYTCRHSSLGGAYQVDVQVPGRQYSLLDLIDAEKMQEQGQKLPAPTQEEWAGLFIEENPSLREVLGYSELALDDISKIIWMRLYSVSAGVYDYEGWVRTRQGRAVIPEDVFKASLAPEDDMARLVAQAAREL